MQKLSEDGGIYGQTYVGVVEHDEWTVAAELKHHAL
jgi:hypothetical protein